MATAKDYKTLMLILTLLSETYGQLTSTNMLYTIIPVKSDTWWKSYVNGTSNHSGLPYLSDVVSLNLKKFNNSIVNIGTTTSREEGSVTIGESVFDTGLTANLSHEIEDEKEVLRTRNWMERLDTEKPGDGLEIPEVILANRIASIFPPFVPSSSSRMINERCIKESQYYLQEFNNFSLWALKMYDASAKIPSGLLNGNVNHYGDMQQCLGVRAPWQEGVIKGRYCLTTTALQLSDPDRPALQQVKRLLMSHDMFRSQLDDPGHRVPCFSSIHWALCIPAACTAKDVEIALSDLLQKHTENTGISLKVRVAPEMCQVQADGWFNIPASTLIVGVFFVSIGILAFFATLCDPEWNERDIKDLKLSTRSQVVQAFSLRKNVLILLSLSRHPDDVESVHGLRAINALLLFIAHKCMALFFNPYLDRTYMAEALGLSWTGFARGACVYTDPFLLISGLLTSYSMYKELERRQKLDLIREYTSRIVRILPNLVALMLFAIFILPWIGNGPLWNKVVQQHTDICMTSWWRNLLFIQNYIGFEKMCLTHTHHLGIDTQLFVLSPILIYLIWRWPRFGLSILTAVAAISTALRYNVTYSERLSYYILFGSSGSTLFKTANLSYTLPTHRATVYVMGIALGIALRCCGRDFKLKKKHLILGWTAALVCFYISTIHPSYMANHHYVYNPGDAANFAAFAPITWCVFIGWIIFVSFIGQGGLLSDFLSWRGFLVTTRLSYALYLLQFPIFFYTVGRNRVTQSFSLFLLLDVPELLLIVTGCVLLTLLFDLPFQNIRNIFLKKPKKSSSHVLD